jgi:hypothetical protein
VTVEDHAHVVSTVNKVLPTVTSHQADETIRPIILAVGSSAE